jgi:hypothetical protein
VKKSPGPTHPLTVSEKKAGAKNHDARDERNSWGRVLGHVCEVCAQGDGVYGCPAVLYLVPTKLKSKDVPRGHASQFKMVLQ